MPNHTLRLFRVAAVLEALSWAALLIGMFFKRVVETTDLGVKIAGPIHGGFFILYCLSVLLVRERLRWDNRTTALGLLASVPPFASVIFERWVLRRDAGLPVAEAPAESAEELTRR